MKNQEEILIHKDQSVLDDYLKEDNEVCLKCQWICHMENTCDNPISENYENNINTLHHTECEDQFNEEMIFAKSVAEKGLFDD